MSSAPLHNYLHLSPTTAQLNTDLTLSKSPRTLPSSSSSCWTRCLATLSWAEVDSSSDSLTPFISDIDVPEEFFWFITFSSPEGTPQEAEIPLGPLSSYVPKSSKSSSMSTKKMLFGASWTWIILYMYPYKMCMKHMTLVVFKVTLSSRSSFYPPFFLVLFLFNSQTQA